MNDFMEAVDTNLINLCTVYMKGQILLLILVPIQATTECIQWSNLQELIRINF